jgi:hypothetical protein
MTFRPEDLANFVSQQRGDKAGGADITLLPARGEDVPVGDFDSDPAYRLVTPIDLVQAEREARAQGASEKELLNERLDAADIDMVPRGLSAPSKLIVPRERIRPGRVIKVDSPPLAAYVQGNTLDLDSGIAAIDEYTVQLSTVQMNMIRRIIGTALVKQVKAEEARIRKDYAMSGSGRKEKKVVQKRSYVRRKALLQAPTAGDTVAAPAESE